MPRRKKVVEEVEVNVTNNEDMEEDPNLLPETSGEAAKRVGRLDSFKGYIPSIRGAEVYIFNINIHLIDEMLGTAPGDPEIYKTYLSKKAPDAKSISEEIESLSVEEVADAKRTIFHKDKKRQPFIYDYMIRGQFKNACAALREKADTKSKGLTSYKSKIDRLVFVGPRRIKIEMPEGGKIGICERPLRAQTPMGERVALASSETVPKGSQMRFSVVCFTKQTAECMFDWLDYGSINGLGQWHNGSKGRFLWELLDREGNPIEGGNYGLQTLGEFMQSLTTNDLCFDDDFDEEAMDQLVLEDIKAQEEEKEELSRNK